MTLRVCVPLLRDDDVLVVAGAGPLLANLQGLADEPGIADQVVRVPRSGSDRSDTARVEAVVAAQRADDGQRRRPAPAALIERDGARAAAHRVDANYDHILSARHG